MHSEDQDEKPPTTRTLTPSRRPMFKSSHRPPPHEPRPDDGTDPYLSERSCIMFPNGAKFIGVQITKDKEQG